MADHMPTKIWQERPNEFTYLCSCGLLAKHMPFGEWINHG